MSKHKLGLQFFSKERLQEIYEKKVINNQMQEIAKAIAEDKR